MKAGNKSSGREIEQQQIRSVVLGTAGHVDHGKTALVFALTGTDTDRLPEEKSRGITIDLGFASLRLPDVNGQAVDLSLIDVPGHHAFVRNMLAGAGGIDCVLLVIAADEGIRAQTEEHLAICSLLGIRHGLIALTKMDAVGAQRLAEVREEVRRFVKHTLLEDAPVVFVSALTREGIPELKVRLAELVSRVPERSRDVVTRLPLDRAFSVRGFGTVVTGTLSSGTIRAEDVLEQQPQGRPIRVRGIQVHGKSREQAHAPNRVALNLAGVETTEVSRGDVLVPPHTLRSTMLVDAEITMVLGMPALKHRAKVRFHAFTADTPATVLLYGERSAEASTMLVRIRLERPMVLAPGDRFVVRLPSPASTVGGGLVLDAQPLPRLRKSAVWAWLQQLRELPPERQLLSRVRRRGVSGASIRALVGETGLSIEAVKRLLRPFLEAHDLVAAGGLGGELELLLSREALAQAAEAAAGEIGRAKGGTISRAELRSKTKLEGWVFELAVQLLQSQDRVRSDNNVLSMVGRDVAGSRVQDMRALEVERIYANAGLASPILSEVSGKLGIGPQELHATITTLLRSKKLVRMGADNLLVHSDALNELVADLRKRRGESFDVGRFKSFTGLTRKHAIPVLEYLDGARVTRNSNGTRTVL